MGLSQIDVQPQCWPIVCIPLGDKMSLLYGLQKQGMPVTYLMIVRAQVLISQSIFTMTG